MVQGGEEEKKHREGRPESIYRFLCRFTTQMLFSVSMTVWAEMEIHMALLLKLFFFFW